jgi:hypothetical protein
MKADRALPAVESSPALRALLERWRGDPGNTYRGSSLETVWFALAFTCIGLETRVADVVSMQGGPPGSGIPQRTGLQRGLDAGACVPHLRRRALATPVFK